MNDLVVLTPLSAMMFVGELAQFSFRCSSAAEVSFELSVEGSVVFSNSYVPDSSLMVTVFDLDRLLDATVSSVGALCVIKIDGNVVSPEGMRVFRCAASMDVPAAYFVNNHFLSSNTEVRITDPARRELLNLFCASEQAASVEALYYTGAQMLLQRIFMLDMDSGARCLDVSPRRWRGSVGQLVSFTVKCGQRRMTYIVQDISPEVSDAFIFLNGFGCWETFYLTGLRETTPEYERESAVVNGFRRNYNIHQTVRYKSLTGPLSHGMEPVAMDLAASPAVFFLEPNGDAGREVIITECDLRHDNDPTASSNLSFSFSTAAVSYRLADDRTARLAVPKPANVFDHTFDDEFE